MNDALDRFALSSEQSELLLGFEEAKNLRVLAQKVGRDVSVVSRQLQGIARRAPVLEKIKNQWRLTALGQQLNICNREMIWQQRLLLAQPGILRVGATRTFAAKALAADLSFLQNVNRKVCLHLVSIDNGVETALLNGRVDMAFACGAPEDPGIRRKSVASERYVAVASAKFCRQWKLTNMDSVFKSPHLLFRNPAGVLPFRSVSDLATNIYAVYEDGLCVLEALQQHCGWTILPFFAVKTAVAEGALVILQDIALPSEPYGVWWLTQRTALKPWVQAALKWLKAQTL